MPSIPFSFCMPKLAPDDQAAFDRLVATLEHHEGQDASNDSVLNEMSSRHAKATIREMYHLQRQVVSRLCENNRQGLLDAIQQCATSIKQEILAIMISDGKLRVGEVEKYL
jgi:hypothetical protein